MNSEFDGPELLVGEIAAVRTFDLRSDGSLWPVFAADQAWSASANEATCQRHYPAGAPGCKCGYWAYGSIDALRDQPASRDVAAVVSCWGRATPGTRGLRAQFARLDAIWLSRRVGEDLRSRVERRYEGVPVYADRDAMLAAHPLTALPSYQPVTRGWRLILARAMVRFVVATMLVLGVLPRSELDAGWLNRLHEQATLTLVYAAIIAVSMYLQVRFARRLRAPHLRILVVIAAFAAWIWAPYAGVGWQILLRAPIALWLVSLVRRRLRFVPTRAMPPRPSANPATG